MTQTIDIALKAASKAMGIPPEDIVSKKRVTPLPLARKLVIYCSRLEDPAVKCKDLAKFLGMADTGKKISAYHRSVYDLQRQDTNVRSKVKSIQDEMKVLKS